MESVEAGGTFQDADTSCQKPLEYQHLAGSDLQWNFNFMDQVIISVMEVTLGMKSIIEGCD